MTILAQVTESNFDNICLLCIASKQTKVTNYMQKGND